MSLIAFVIGVLFGMFLIGWIVTADMEQIFAEYYERGFKDGMESCGDSGESERLS